jgi:hypothetical protein
MSASVHQISTRRTPAVPIERLSDRTLALRLETARTLFTYSKTAIDRRVHMRTMDDIRREMLRRGLPLEVA